MSSSNSDASREEALKKEREELANIERAREAKIAEGQALVVKHEITSTREMPRPLPPGTLYRDLITLQTNLFGIRMEKDDFPIYKYDVLITADIGTKHVEFTKKGKSDWMVLERRKTCMAVFKMAIPQLKAYREDLYFFYDGQSLVYTIEDIDFENPSKPNETVILKGSDVSKELEKFDFIYFNIKECTYNGKECHISDIRKIDRMIMKKDRSACQFVDVVTSMNALMQSDRFTVFQNGKIFPTRPDIERIPTVRMAEGKLLIPGMSKTVKLIEGPRGRNNASPALAIDSLRVAFHQKQKLIDKAMEFFRDIYSINANDMVEFAKICHGLGCVTNHIKNPRTLEICGFAREDSSKRCEFRVESGLYRVMSIAEYFKLKYNLDLKYPTVNLAMSRERGNINLYPMEVLDVLPMQRVTLSQTTPAQSQVTTKECAVPPSTRQNHINLQCKAHDLFNPDQEYLKAAGLGIIPTPLQAEGRILRSPVIQYGKNEMEAMPPTWKPSSHIQWARPAKCERWVVYVTLTSRDRFEKAEAQKFADAFMKRCRERGMSMPPPADVEILPPPAANQTDDMPIREKMMDDLMVKTELAVFISSDFSHVHKYLKLQERYSRIVTQDIKLSTVQNFLDRNQSQTLENIVMKTNIKLGGLNYAIHLKNVVGDKVNPFPPHRLVIGIGMVKAPYVESYMTPKGVKLPSPSVVGYSANIAHHPTEFIGDYIYQDSRKNDVMMCSRDMMQHILDRFTGSVDCNGVRTKTPTKPKPTEVLIYRQGLSEAYYGLCLGEEIPIIMAVLAENEVKDCKLTYIIVTKEHNVRLMKSEIEAKEKPPAQNIGAGVVIDSQITNPRYREFYLNSHVTLQGTARTPRYTVLFDNSEMKMNSLESITYAYAYNFQVVNSPVSLPAPLYIANRYAERGSNIFWAKASDENATSEQKIRVALHEMNEDLTLSHCKLGNVRINA